MFIKVAIKIMDVSSIKEDYVVRNLFREAKIMAKLNHPCIAALFQTMQHGNMYYIVSELVNGGDLCAFIKGQKNGRLEEQYTRVYARQLISAISHMHNLGVVHRDLKMENIMLSAPNNRVKIVDFGLSNIYDGGTPLKTHCGSPEYAAPELFIEGKHYGPEVDLWSFGVILYGMVVGQLPFVSKVKEGAVASHQQRRKRLLEQINKGLSPSHRKTLALFSAEFRAMMAKLLVADSSKRIKIAELVCHPWVTEKGRKSIRTNPMRKIDERTQINITKDVAVLTNMDFHDVQFSVKTDPYGNIAGIYNLIYHQHSKSSLDPEAITNKTVATCISPRSKEFGLNLDLPIKTPVKRQGLLRSAPLQRVLHKTSSTQQTCVKSIDASGKVAKRPSTVKEDVGYFAPQRKNVSSYRFSHNAEGLRERVCSVCTPIQEMKRVSAFSYSGSNKPPAGGDATPKTASFDKQGYFAHLKNMKAKMDERPISRSLRTQSANISLNTPSSLRSPIIGQLARRPLTTGPTHAAERAAKRRSLLPVLSGKNAAKGMISTTTGAVVTHKSHKSVLEKQQEYAEECRRHIISPVKCFSSNRIKDFSNEPIARSIAGYVTKNISNRLDPLKWAKDAKINIGS